MYVLLCSLSVGETSDAEEISTSLEHDPSFEIEEEACMIGKKEEPVQKFMSIIITNLQINYEGWQAELPKNPEENNEEENNDKDESDLDTPLDDDENAVFDLAENETTAAKFNIPEVKVDGID